MTSPAPELANTTQLTSYRSGDAATMLAAAEATVRAYCGWHIAPVRLAQQVTVNSSGAKVLALPTLRLNAVTAVTVDGIAVPLTDVQWSQAGYLWRATPWTSELRGISATIDHGYEAVPVEVQAVVLAVAARAAASPDGVIRQQVGQVSVTFTQSGFNIAGGMALLEHERAVLDRYRLP